jgi:hypothetical protein
MIRRSKNPEPRIHVGGQAGPGSSVQERIQQIVDSDTQGTCQGEENIQYTVFGFCMWKKCRFFPAGFSFRARCLLLFMYRHFHCRTFSIDYLKIGGASICLYVKPQKNK